MANVKPVKVCKHCGAGDLPDPLPKYCMECGSPVVAHQSALFTAPSYLSSQRDQMIEAMGKERLSPGDSIFDQRVLEAGNEMVRIAREAPYKWQLDCLLDSKLFLENLLHSSLTRKEVVEVVKLGQAIGTISNAVSEYLKCGGKHSDRVFRRVQADQRGDGWGGEPAFEGPG